MNRLSLTAVVIVAFFFSGCAGLNLNLDGDAKELAIKIAAKHLAYELAKENPDLINKGIEYADGLIATTSGFEPLFAFALNQIDKEVKNPVLRSDYRDLVGLIKIEGNLDFGKAKVVCSGFRAGLILRKEELAK